MENTKKELIGDLENQLFSSIETYLRDFRSVEKDLHVRPINIDDVAPGMIISLVPGVDDIAMQLYIDIASDGKYAISTPVSRGLINSWELEGVRDEDFMNIGIQNTMKSNPPCVTDILEFLSGLAVENESVTELFSDKAKDVIPSWSQFPYYILTLKNLRQGAVAVFLPGVCGRLCELLDDDLLIAFTSKHEAFIHAASTINPEAVKSVVNGMKIENVTIKKDWLTESVYFYDRERKVFEKR